MARPTLRPHTSALHPHSALCTPAGDIPAIKAILVVDADGKRILSRYYSADWPTSADETSFEKKLYDKTMRTNAKNEGGLASALATPATTSSAHISAALAPGLLMCLLHARRAAEVIMFDNVVTVYRNSADVWFYVVGSQCDVRVQTRHDQELAGLPWLPDARAPRRSLSPAPRPADPCAPPCDRYENELILVHVLTALHEALNGALRCAASPHRAVALVLQRRSERASEYRVVVLLCVRTTPDKRTLLDNFDTLLLTVDELIDGGGATAAPVCPSAPRLVRARTVPAAWHTARPSTPLITG